MKSIGTTALLLLLTACSGNTDLDSLLSNEDRLLKDSEFSIIFPDESLSVRAKEKRIDAASHDGHKQRSGIPLEFNEYKELLTQLRDLDESEFEDLDAAACHERVEFRLRVGRQKRSFIGCRGTGANATTLSKLVRHLEFLLVKRTSS